MPETGITLLWSDDDGNDRAYIVEQEVVVGRNPGDPTYKVIIKAGGKGVDTGIHDPSVSRTHAKLAPDRGGIIVIDVGSRGKGSTNGTYVDERRIPPATPVLVKPGSVIRFGLYTVMRVATRSEGRNLIVMKPGESIILPKEKIAGLTGLRGVDVADLGRGKAAVYLSDDVSFSSIEIGRDKIRVDRSGAESRTASMLLDMRLKLVEAKRLLEFEPPRLEEAAVKLAVLVRLRRYRELIAEAAGEELVRELESALERVRSGRAIPGLARRLRSISSELLELIDSMRLAGV